MRRFRNYDLPGQRPVLAWNPIVMRCPGCGRDWPEEWKGARSNTSLAY